jgi:hypothetical protein
MQRLKLLSPIRFGMRCVVRILGATYCKGFPYALYYRVGSEEIRILAVKHHSRHPDYWKNR